MTEFTTRPATAENWDDVVAALSGGGDGRSCSCQWWYRTNAEWSAETSDDRRAALRRKVDAGPPRGLVGYVDGAAAGWCRIAPRLEQTRITRARVPRASPHPMSEPGIWAITCLEVRREHRGLGLTRVMIDAAVELARAAGATRVEAYPIDTAVRASSTNDLYVGAASTFTAAGFRETARPTPARPVMELVL